MPNFRSLVGVLAISTSLTGGAIALDIAMTAGAANAGTVMGGCGGCGNGWGRGHRNHNRNWNRNHERQHERQRQHQRQTLMRDFTLLITPFQKSDNKANPLQKQNTEAESKAVYPPAPSRHAPVITPGMSG
ncbi:hypothetical protein GCM10023194_34990 [Planotetraspora phitsanulokensis]|uniref:Uncharacterized protein n=1 Tax=Planotetraspora phitsanulokensis TaxID=575192 RepID=A0A8J3U3M6_9ACTN|nr:hypothetical protein [Planotetraspora phitsanulokensis]GII36372.1 hypothetical protein Pph01_13750 [Planotetraspora phitsanulokensis]